MRHGLAVQFPAPQPGADSGAVEQLELLMRELHHRVKNNLAIISGLLNLQSYELVDEQAIRAVQQGQQRVEAMSLIHQRLYQTEHVTRLDIREYITDLAESLMHAYGYDRTRFDLTIDVSEQWLDVELAIPLGLILNELITNSFKYAYQHVDYPALRIALRCDGGLILDVQHNGPGIELSRWYEPGGSFGKQLIFSLGEQLGGQYELSTDQGTHFRLSIFSNTKTAA
ncbi:MAG: sensor histidine kinase [Cytophagaceae bacterium]|nr:sensor histidine kinase [Cytophagaceae bacterium]